MKIERQTIVGIAESILPEFDAYLVDVRIRGERGETLVQVLADTDSGISISACATISRKIAANLEEDGLIETRYRLEVSSPGLDRPLKVLRQYVTSTGRPVRLRHTSSEGEQEVHGTLRGVEGETVLLEGEDGTTHRIGFDTIRDCRHRLPW